MLILEVKHTQGNLRKAFRFAFTFKIQQREMPRLLEPDHLYYSRQPYACDCLKACNARPGRIDSSGKYVWLFDTQIDRWRLSSAFLFHYHVVQGVHFEVGTSQHTHTMVSSTVLWQLGFLTSAVPLGRPHTEILWTESYTQICGCIFFLIFKRT